MIREFHDVFPRKLPRLAPEREIEFNIELILSTNTISIAPYFMGSLELRELKVQL